MAAYKINGNDCTQANGCMPSKHTVSQANPTKVTTIGGVVLIEPTTGPVRVHTWVYDGRGTETLDRLRSFLALEQSPVVLIDTYDVRRDPTTHQDILLTNLVCTCEIPELTTDGKRNLTESFSLVFSELYPQS